jgi:hypothetical protein
VPDISISLLVTLTLAAVVCTEAQPAKSLAAPTFYIAASAEYYNASTTLDVKGASNLPPGSRLRVSLYDFIGYKSSVLSEDEDVVLNKDGFFEVTLKPLQEKQFKDNMVCDILFSPIMIPQNPSVLAISGKKGELLGGEHNPQVHKNSGGYYLEAIVHVP